MPLLQRTRPLRRIRRPAIPPPPPPCLFCSRSLPWLRALSTTSRARKSSVPTSPTPTSPRHADSPRAQLIAALRALETKAPDLVPRDRLRLALRSLQQPAGLETVRVAVLGLAGSQGQDSATARALLRLLLADPLQDAPAAWERQIQAHAGPRPLVVRVVDGAAAATKAAEAPKMVNFSTTTTASSTPRVAELEVASDALRGLRLEFLLVDNPASAALETMPLWARDDDGWDERVLMPTTPPATTTAASASASNPAATPVHQALLVADGLRGVAAVGTMPRHDAIRAVVNGVTPTDEDSLNMFVVNTTAADEGLQKIRAGVANAHAYETLWRQGGLTPLAAWLRDGARDRADGTTKAPVRQAVAAVLAATRSKLLQQTGAVEEAGTSGTPFPQTPVSTPSTAFYEGLAAWAEDAHAELQARLDDDAFARGPWRALGWWKLFWRVDDVSALAGAVVTQQFLVDAERRAIFLAGSVGFVPETPDTPPWPNAIAHTRSYLLAETVPALQALAQKLVLQTLGASGLTAALGGLLYASSASSALLGTVTAASAGGGLYEGGAVAALGLVWSLRRLQTQWEAARAYWEAGVREEGRKAVRAVEASMAAAVEGAGEGQGGEADEVVVALREITAVIEEAEDALERMP